MSEAIDVVVHCTRGRSGPRVMEIVAVEDLAGGPDSTQFTTTSLFRRAGYDQPLAATGLVPARAEAAFADAGIDLRALLHDPSVAAPGHRHERTTF